MATVLWSSDGSSARMPTALSRVFSALGLRAPGLLRLVSSVDDGSASFSGPFGPAPSVDGSPVGGLWLISSAFMALSADASTVDDGSCSGLVSVSVLSSECGSARSALGWNGCAVGSSGQWFG